MSKKPQSIKRIEKAKRKYKAAEVVTDSLILRLAASKYTLCILIGIAAAVLLVWAW